MGEQNGADQQVTLTVTCSNLPCNSFILLFT